MFVACGIWCLADVSSVSPSSEQTQISVRLEFEKRHFQCACYIFTSIHVINVTDFQQCLLDTLRSWCLNICLLINLMSEFGLY